MSNEKTVAGVHTTSPSWIIGMIIGWLFTVDALQCHHPLHLGRTSHARSYRFTHSLSPLYIFTYGRGADIWPECNEDPVQLTDSFPNGEIPYSAILAMDQQDMAAVHISIQESISNDVSLSEESEVVMENSGGGAAAAADAGRSKTKGKQRRRLAPRFFVSKTVRRLLRRAAAKEELDIEQATLNETPGIWNQLLAVIPILLLAQGLVGPTDIMAVASFSTYFVILQMVARSPRDGGLAPIMPAVPPQGHVPTMVSNPMGIGTLYSAAYERWLRLGIVVGFVAPLIQLAHYLFRAKDVTAARLCARPIFLLCCQALTEAYSKRVMAPLPIRILIPISYNTLRLGYLWTWASTVTVLGWPGRTLAIGSFLYWGLNLTAFLIPVALVRYMRAYFFGVEAAEVTTRMGMEDTIGLVPNLS